MATREEIGRALREDDAFRRRSKMTPEERNPPFTIGTDCDDFVNQMTEEEIAESKKLLTPLSIKD